MQSALVRFRTISIHAPARGATIDETGTCEIESISIHAPARGATCIGLACLWPQANFNPRSRAGSDLTHGEWIRSADNISIHAPARGATEV